MGEKDMQNEALLGVLLQSHFVGELSNMEEKDMQNEALLAVL